MGNAMKALENRTLDSKREMDIMAALDEMRTLKAKHSKVSSYTFWLGACRISLILSWPSLAVPTLMLITLVTSGRDTNTI